MQRGWRQHCAWKGMLYMDGRGPRYSRSRWRSGLRCSKLEFYCCRAPSYKLSRLVNLRDPRPRITEKNFKKPRSSSTNFTTTLALQNALDVRSICWATPSRTQWEISSFRMDVSGYKRRTFWVRSRLLPVKKVDTLLATTLFLRPKAAEDVFFRKGRIRENRGVMCWPRTSRARTSERPMKSLCEQKKS